MKNKLLFFIMLTLISLCGCKSTYNLEPESASDLAAEVEETIDEGVKHCSDTTLKLKDSLETSLHQHHDDYEKDITRHNELTIKHYDDSDADVKRLNDDFTGLVAHYGQLQGKHQGAEVY